MKANKRRQRVPIELHKTPAGAARGEAAAFCEARQLTLPRL
jgi:hypothetical protein